MMTVLWFVSGVVLTVVGLACSVGAVLPRDHVATGSLAVRAGADAVWQAIRDVEGLPSWRRSVNKIEGVERDGERGARRWTEHGTHGPMTMIVDECVEAKRLVTRIDDTKLPFGGSWTFELTPVEDADGGGVSTRVRITERGFVKMPPMRAIAKVFMDPRANLVAYLQDLSAKHGGGGGVEE